MALYVEKTLKQMSHCHSESKQSCAAKRWHKM